MEHKKHQQYLIALEKELDVKETYALYLEFKGALSSNLEGFYKSSYKTKSGQERSGVVIILKHFSSRKHHPSRLL